MFLLKETMYRNETARHTVYDTLIINHLDNNTLTCLEQHKQNGRVMKKARRKISKFWGWEA